MRREILGLMLGAFVIYAQPSLQMPGTPHTGRRLALVIGNNAYSMGRLKNAVNDATAVSEEMQKRHFYVTLLTNTTSYQLEVGVETFLSKVSVGDVVLVFYAGHGMQISGENYLVPIDFNPTDAVGSGFPASRLQERLSTQGARVVIVMLDSCRTNPFTGRQFSNEWVRMGWGVGTYAAYATTQGGTASDEPAGDHGLFTKHFLNALTIPDLDIDDLFNRVRKAVYEESQGSQVTSQVSELLNGFVFTDRAPGDSGTAVAAVRRMANSPPDRIEAASVAIREDPKNPVTHYIRGLGYLRAGNANAAIADFTSAMAVSPHYAVAFRERGRSFLVLGDYKRAAEDLTEATRIAPQDVASSYLLALTSAVMGNDARALRDTTTLIQQRPAVAAPYVIRAAVLVRATRYAEAVSDCDRAIALDPANSSARAVRMIALRALGGGLSIH